VAAEHTVEAVLARQDRSVDLYGYVCPGCGRRARRHPPLCPVAVRLTAEDAKRNNPHEWEGVLLDAARLYGGMYRCAWHPVARHFRAAAAEPEPDTGPYGEPGCRRHWTGIVWSPAEGVFVERNRNWHSDHDHPCDD
jgi:hypothetical protein